MRGRSQLALTHARLTQWRAQHGGRWITVPEELWAEVVKVALVEGPGTTAHGAHCTTARTAPRSSTGRSADGDGSGTEVAEASRGLVEIDACRLRLSPRTVVRFRARDPGECSSMSANAARCSGCGSMAWAPRLLCVPGATWTRRSAWGPRPSGLEPRIRADGGCTSFGP